MSDEDIVYGDLLFVHGDGKEDLFVYPDVLSFEYFWNALWDILLLL